MLRLTAPTRDGTPASPKAPGGMEEACTFTRLAEQVLGWRELVMMWISNSSHGRVPLAGRKDNCGGEEPYWSLGRTAKDVRGIEPGVARYVRDVAVAGIPSNWPESLRTKIKNYLHTLNILISGGRQKGRITEVKGMVEKGRAPSLIVLWAIWLMGWGTIKMEVTLRGRHRDWNWMLDLDLIIINADGTAFKKLGDEDWHVIEKPATYKENSGKLRVTEKVLRGQPVYSIWDRGVYTVRQEFAPEWEFRAEPGDIERCPDTIVQNTAGQITWKEYGLSRDRFLLDAECSTTTVSSNKTMSLTKTYGRMPSSTISNRGTKVTPNPFKFNLSRSNALGFGRNRVRRAITTTIRTAIMTAGTVATIAAVGLVARVTPDDWTIRGIEYGTRAVRMAAEGIIRIGDEVQRHYPDAN
ncbi:hypothetical protein B0T21DRAFT_348104 [Apiosordaria backusii]|uniref:Uncharacterized protein n=1 Tax=Apiosordaria backusii TaxID=314023 RepID=A0AA40EHG6_9PEZI|nr:hypothetical protein B0T21DRAFT_348104 [Apiosordaria backusii]